MSQVGNSTDTLGDVGSYADFRKFPSGCSHRATREASVLDSSKIPAGLVVHRVWVPQHASDLRRPIAYVGERRRRVIGAAVLALAVILAPAAMVLRAGFWFAFAALLIAWAGVAYAGGGRTGYYEVGADGTLGRYLGRSRPDLGSMRPSGPCP